MFTKVSEVEVKNTVAQEEAKKITAQPQEGESNSNRFAGNVKIYRFNQRQGISSPILVEKKKFPIVHTTTQQQQQVSESGIKKTFSKVKVVPGNFKTSQIDSNSQAKTKEIPRRDSTNLEANTTSTLQIENVYSLLDVSQTNATNDEVIELD